MVQTADDEIPMTVLKMGTSVNKWSLEPNFVEKEIKQFLFCSKTFLIQRLFC